MINLKHKTQVFIAVLLFGITLSVANSIISSLISQSNYIDNVLEKARDKAVEREKVILNFLESYHLFALSLQNSIIFNNSLNDLDFSTLKNIFDARIIAYKHVSQLRILNENGNEIIRTQRISDHETRTIPINQLQNKSKLYYFKDGITRNSGDIRLSKFDLNIEHGKIVTPHQPTVRIYFPIISNDQNKYLVVINLDLTELLTDITVTTLYNIYLIDLHGEFILHSPNQHDAENYSFSQYLDHQHTITQHFPGHYKNILNSKDYWGDTFYATKIKINNDDNVRLILEVKKSFLDKALSERKEEILSSLYYSILFIFIISLIIANSFEKLRKHFVSELTIKNTELKENASKLKEALQHAEKSNRAKTVFLTNMSHEFRTPMHAILSFASLALKKSTDDKIAKYLKNIRVSGFRLTNLLDDLLDLSKLESGNMDATFAENEFSQIVQKAINEVSSLAQDKHITITFDKEQHYECTFDSTLMAQLTINLLSNAIKFSHNDSQVQVQIKLINTTTANEDDSKIRLSIIDQGVGIPVDEIQDIFDKFIQSSKTKSGTGGTGLGLSICKEIATLHHGAIWAESPPNGQDFGTAVYFEFPIKPETGVPNIDLLINSHLEFKNSLDNLLTNTSNNKYIPVSTIANENICALARKLNTQYAGQDLNELRKLHKQYHQLTGEYVAYVSMSSTKEAKEVKLRLDELTDELITLIKALEISES